MPLPSSGPLSLNDIQTEFGGTNPIGLNEYYAGGGLVPAGTTGTNGAVPSSGAISIFNFYGTAAVIPQWSSGFEALGGFGNILKGIPRVVGNSLIYGFSQTSNQSTFYVASINAGTGAINWANKFDVGGSNYDTNGNGSFYVDSSGNSYILWGRQTGGVSAVLSKVNSSGNLVWSKSLGLPLYTESASGTNIVTDSASNIYIASANLQNSNNGSALYKYDSNGNFVWARYWTDTTVAVSGFRVGSVAVDASDNIVMWGGNYTGNNWGFLVTFNSSGTFLSANRFFPAPYYSWSEYGSLAVAPSTGNIYITGAFQPTGQNQLRVSVTKLNSSRVVQWTRFLSPTQSTSGMLVALDSSENVYLTSPDVTGNYKRSFTVFNTSGTVLWTTQVGPSPGPGTEQARVQALRATVVSGDSIYFLGSYRYQDAQPQDLFQALRFSITNYLPNGIYLSRSAVSSVRGFTVGIDQSPGIGSTTEPTVATATNQSITNITAATTNATVTQTAMTLPTVYNGTISPVATTGSFSFTTPGLYTWVVPTGVTRVSVIAVGGGNGGNYSTSGGGGGVGMANNYTVTPGASINVRVGIGGMAAETCGQSRLGESSWFNAPCTLRGGSGQCTGNPTSGAGGAGTALFQSGAGGSGNSGYYGAGGAGGPNGNGGSGGVSGGTVGGSGTSGTGGAGGGGGGAPEFGTCTYYNRSPSGSGGGVGIIGLGPSGAGGGSGTTGGAGSNGYFTTFGGGGGAGGYEIFCVGTCCQFSVFRYGGYGGSGAVRIIWPGNTRTFPSTNTGAP